MDPVIVITGVVLSTTEPANTKAASILGCGLRRSGSKWCWGGRNRWNVGELVLQRFSFDDVGYEFHIQLQYLCEVMELLPLASLRIHKRLKMLWKFLEFTKHLILGLGQFVAVDLVVTLA